MERNDICTDFIELIAGTSNKMSRAYTEAVEEVKDNDKAVAYLKNFISSIENIASRGKAFDKRISDSKGVIEDFSGYNDIERSFKFFGTHKTPSGNGIVTDLNSLKDSIIKHKSYYMEGYRKGIRLFMLEYESAMYLLITGLAMALAYNFDVADDYGKTVVKPKPKAYFGITGKKIHEMTEELAKKNHTDYLEQISKAAGQNSGMVNESTFYMYTEGALDAINTTVGLIIQAFGAVKNVASFGLKGIKSIKSTMFGIIPLIRSVIYLSYKRKADTIISLEETIGMLEKNIEFVDKNKTMSDVKKSDIIKRQQAYIETYRKKAEKLRAQLEEGEKDAAAAINKENETIGNTNDDFVLESVEDDFEDSDHARSDV